MLELIALALVVLMVAPFLIAPLVLGVLLVAFTLACLAVGWMTNVVAQRLQGISAPLARYVGIGYLLALLCGLTGHALFSLVLLYPDLPNSVQLHLFWLPRVVTVAACTALLQRSLRDASGNRRHWTRVVGYAPLPTFLTLFLIALGQPFSGVPLLI